MKWDSETHQWRTAQPPPPEPTRPAKGQTLYAAEVSYHDARAVADIVGTVEAAGPLRVVVRYARSPDHVGGRDHLEAGDLGRWCATPEEARANLRARILAEVEEAERKAAASRAWLAQHLPP